MATFPTAVKALVAKNLRYLLLRRFLLVFVVAFAVPIAVGTILSFGQSLFSKDPAKGTGSPHVVQTLKQSLGAAIDSGKDRIFLINNGMAGGDIDRVFDRLERAVETTGTGMQVFRRENDDSLTRECESSAQGMTACYGSIIMLSSPNEGASKLWNYSIQADAALTYATASVDSTDNAAQVYFLPFQKAVDGIISTIDEDNPNSDPLGSIEEFPFTYFSQEEWDNQSYSTNEYVGLFESILGMAWVIPMAIITFHVAGFIAGERESGMSQLIDAMSSTRTPFISQAARITANYLSFVMIYAPSWVIMAITIKIGLLKHSNFGIIFLAQILGGLALTSWGVFFGSLFKKSQWSGISAFILAMAFAILAQMIFSVTTADVIVLSLLFTPSGLVYYFTSLASYESSRTDASGNGSVDITQGIDRISSNGAVYTITPVLIIIFFIIQIFGYLALAVFAERLRHGTASPGRMVLSESEASSTLGESAVRVEGFSKIYKPGFFSSLRCRNRKKPVTAVNNLDFTVRKGQIVALLGANGSGKSTTLDSIGGLRKLTNGKILIDGTGGLGIAPQKNVLWENLTVEEHMSIFNKLKSSDSRSSAVEIEQLIEAVGLMPKRKALAKTLSGGQKRKLQLGMMLVGGSSVCCVDEVSSGIDPLSRRNIWDILLAERGKRTIILTTHFLDEADMLADHIAILSKGSLRAEGSSVELKDKLGGGYRVHVPKSSIPEWREPPQVDGVAQKDSLDMITYISPSSYLAACVIENLEKADITDYRFSNPTIEDVFLQLAEEIESQEALRGTGGDIEFSKEKTPEDMLSYSQATQAPPMELQDSRVIGFMQQAKVLFGKRLVILRRNWVPSAFALLLPALVGALCTLLASKMKEIPGCEFTQGSSYTMQTTPSLFNPYSTVLVGPSEKFSNETWTSLFQPIREAYPDYSSYETDQSYMSGVYLVDTFNDFRSYIDANRTNVKAGIWLGDDSTPPTIAWLSDYSVANPLGVQNVLNIVRSNMTISTSLTEFSVVEYPLQFHAIQIVIYMSLVLILYPPLLALYPSNERRLLVRGMQYSNGVRPLALWLAYLGFDFIVILASTVVITAAWAGGASMLYNVPYMFVVLLFYGLSATMLAQFISLATRSQLANWALAVITQVVFFVAYLAGSIGITGQVAPSGVNTALNGLYFGLGLVSPIVSALKALFVSVNMYKAACDGEQFSGTPGGIIYYGGPILYLILQTIVFSAIVIGVDGGLAGSVFRKLFGRGYSAIPNEVGDAEAGHEMGRLTADRTGLSVSHLTKTFGNNTAVDDVSFDITHGKTFALLGPNGAGKSTIISLIRGDLQPTGWGGHVYVENYSVMRQLALARTKLGVCPQFDALDMLTVREHLEFYAKVRGVSDIDHNVAAIIRAVGIEGFVDTMGHALSGGNKRKLSLAIALMGNPTVLLLDEPSSGLDAASKRIMWQTLASTSQGRSILLTTHSMEEADALADDVGILSHRMLAHDTPDELRHRFGDVLHVHLVCMSAPRTTPDEMDRIIYWVRNTFKSAEVEDKTYHGQIRFTIRAADIEAIAGKAPAVGPVSPVSPVSRNAAEEQKINNGALGQLLVMLESVKASIGIAHYSVSPATLETIFLQIVRSHNGEEENQYEVKLSSMNKFGRFLYA